MKCPECSSTKLSREDHWSPKLLSLRPIKCDNCGRDFEYSLTVRLLFLLSLLSIAGGSLSLVNIESVSEREALLKAYLFAASYIPLFVLLPLALVFTTFRPWRNNREKLRLFINGIIVVVPLVVIAVVL